MNLEIEQVGNVAVVIPDAERIDAGNFEKFKADMQQVMQDHPRVVLDLQKTQFMDSSAMGVVLYCVRESGVNGGGINICSPSPSIRIAFDLIRMSRMVDIFDSREEALKAFGE